MFTEMQDSISTLFLLRMLLHTRRVRLDENVDKINVILLFK